MKKSSLIILVLIFGLALSSSLMAVTRHVTNTDDSGEGSFRYWVENSGDGDEIVFDVTGTITLTSGYISWSNENKSLTITGPGADKLAIDGNNYSRIWAIYQDTGSYDVSISGLTFQNCSSSSGSALSCRYTAGQINITNCTIDSNVGSGIASHAIYNDGNLTLTNCTISNNTGGAIHFNSPGVTTLTNCTISGNTDDYCGGIISWNPTTTSLTNCTITDNTGSSYAGGVAIWSGDVLNLKNCLIAGNSNASNPDIYNSGSDNLNSQGYNLIGNVGNENFSTNTTGDRYGDPNNTTIPHAEAIESATAIDPKLDALALNNSTNGTYAHHISSSSPAKNAGTATGAPTTDQRGASRNGATDIGAYEYWDDDASLPVELSSFTAESRSGGVLLKWCTESEIENLGFLIEKQILDAGCWMEIAGYLTDVDLEGHGSTTEKHEYQYIDKAVQPGATYEYRLGDVDYSGKVTWHKKLEVKVEAESAKIPTEFGLQRAYPNPFNPTTTISYQLASASFVKISIYDVRGKLVETLVNEQKDRGSYSLVWDADGLSSGIYLYKIAAGEYSEVNKCLLIR